jgi:hypothetical protein
MTRHVLNCCGRCRFFYFVDCEIPSEIFSQKSLRKTSEEKHEQQKLWLHRIDRVTFKKFVKQTRVERYHCLYNRSSFSKNKLLTIRQTFYKFLKENFIKYLNRKLISKAKEKLKKFNWGCKEKCLKTHTLWGCKRGKPFKSLQKKLFIFFFSIFFTLVNAMLENYIFIYYVFPIQFSELITWKLSFTRIVQKYCWEWNSKISHFPPINHQTPRAKWWKKKTYKYLKMKLKNLNNIFQLKL